MQKIIAILIISFYQILSVGAFAAEPVSNTNTSTNWVDFEKMKKNVRAGYSGIFTGPTTAALDGDADGKGTNLLLKNYFTLGYQFSSLLLLEASHELRRYWRPFDPKKNVGSGWESRDPYLTLRLQNFLKWEEQQFSMGGKIRYYFPISEYTKNGVGKNIDSGNGRWNAELAMTKKYFEEKLSFRLKNNFYYRLAKNPQANVVREQYSLTFAPSVQYRLGSKWQAKAEYYSGEIRHLSSGKWTKFNDPALGQTIALGGVYQPNKKLSMNPYLQWGRGNSFRLDRTDIGLYADYYFL